MSILDDLQATDSSARSKTYDPVRVRRRKLAGALQEQHGLLKATVDGHSYSRHRRAVKEDLETEERVEIETRSRVSPWWWVNDDGGLEFSLRYGSVKLKVKDGKDTLMLPSLAKLSEMLPALRQEVLSGGLDAALAEAAVTLEQRFKARKKKPKAPA